MQQTGASGGLGALGAKEIVEELNERINILMAENTVMADQVLQAFFADEVVSSVPVDRPIFLRSRARLDSMRREAACSMPCLQRSGILWRLPCVEQGKHL